MSNLVPVGALRFNTETAKLEYFDGTRYVNITTRSPESETGGTRGVTNGINENPQWQAHMDFFNISTGGNGTDFGDLSYSARNVRGNSDAHGGLAQCRNKDRYNQLP